MPIITRLDSPVEILPLDVIKEFIGLDSDIDAEQDKILPVLLHAGIEQGEQITGIVWAAASYRIEGLRTVGMQDVLRLPLTPALAVAEVVGKDASGADIPVPSTAYRFVPSSIEFGRPWAELRAMPGWPGNTLNFSVTCTVGWNADSFPRSLQGWLLNRIATLYDFREDLVTGTITANLPRDHSRGLLDRWTVRSDPCG